MEKYKVFYSWQSDLPNAANRGFIEKALEDAAKNIRADESIKVEPVIDRDTAGVPGSPDIANTIFAKVEQSQVFACDVSIINQGEKSRKTPNPNVLIELGYALKILGSERILMIMNTAFGPPEQLPFDLSKKRVVTYHMPEECKDRATERKVLTSRLQEALRTIFTEISRQPRMEPTQKSLQEECSEIIEHNNIAAWRQLVETMTDEIIEKLLTWKHTGEASISSVTSGFPANWQPWKDAVFEAMKISLPGIVPLLTAISATKEDCWRESTSFLRRLILLRRDMGGGTVQVIEIGNSILYVFGSIGMALSARTRQPDFVTLWARLVLPPADGQGERIWCDISEINYWQPGVTGHNNDPYGFIAQLLELDDLRPFFENPERFQKSLFMGNLLHSLVEFKMEAARKGYNESLKKPSWAPNVMPIWCLMKPQEFENEVWRIFGSSADVIKFAYPGIMPSAEKFWPLWEAWKKKCVAFMSDGSLWPLRNIYALNLPGEPQMQS